MIQHDYEERVYAGVLGKVIAVYLGRPFEGWRYQRIADELGDITYYVNHRVDLALKNHLLVVTDDDISGTLIFPRALRDHGTEPTSAQVGETWLNEIVEEQSVLWWGGLGNSTEHTAYLRMKAGTAPPESGSIALNGQVVAEQVGAQIFVEGFAMTRPGDPEAAADLVERAARVSHDGESIHAARVVAALVAGAFTEPDMDRLLDTAAGLIPKDSLIHRVVADVREWAAGGDWKATRDRIEERYGYHLYGGNCHIVPNHATVINALAHSKGEFGAAMTVVNTSGWDTDSNAGDVGSICGVFQGIKAFDGQDWRGPVADRLYLPSADGGSTITDAAREALALASYGRIHAGQDPVVPKDGARFHFSLPGSVQGFTVADGTGTVAQDNGALQINPEGSKPVTVTTPAFIPPEALDMPIYGLIASPTLYPGQTVTARVSSPTSAGACLTLRVYDENDALRAINGPAIPLTGDTELTMTVPNLGGQPVAAVGITASGPVTVDRLTWDGAPDVTLTRAQGSVWRRAWVRAVDRWDPHWPEPFRIVQNRGTGLLVQGERGWRDYTVTADVTPHLAKAAGIAGRVQRFRRCCALELAGRDTVRLVRGGTVLAAQPFGWEFGRTYQLALTVDGDRIAAAVDGEPLFEIHGDDALDCGGVALTVTEGRTATQQVRITPISREESS